MKKFKVCIDIDKYYYNNDPKYFLVRVFGFDEISSKSRWMRFDKEYFPDLKYFFILSLLFPRVKSIFLLGLKTKRVFIVQKIPDKIYKLLKEPSTSNLGKELLYKYITNDILYLRFRNLWRFLLCSFQKLYNKRV